MPFSSTVDNVKHPQVATLGLMAMDSASDFVKSQADYATGGVDELGILTALEHYGVL